MKTDLTQLNRLEEYLKEHGIQYERIDKDDIYFDRHQLIIPHDGEGRQWDAICQYGSYGWSEGLLEIYGTLVSKKPQGDSVIGHLTANDVIELIEMG